MRIARWTLLLLAVMILFAGCAPAESEEPLAALTSPQDAQALLDGDGNVVLLDVRNQGEWVTDGHAADATLIPLDELERRTSELDRDATIVVVCRSGNRSQIGAQILRDAGFSRVTEVDGGMNNWTTQGLGVVFE